MWINICIKKSTKVKTKNTKKESKSGVGLGHARGVNGLSDPTE